MYLHWYIPAFYVNHFTYSIILFFYIHKSLIVYKVKIFQFYGLKLKEEIIETIPAIEAERILSFIGNNRIYKLMHRLVKIELLNEKKESSCFYGTFPESVLSGGILLSFRRLFAAFYIYIAFIYILLAHRDLSLEWRDSRCSSFSRLQAG